MVDKGGPNGSKSDDPDAPERVYARSFLGTPPGRVRIPLILATLFVVACTAVFLHDPLPSWLVRAEALIWAAVLGVWVAVIIVWRRVRRRYVHSEHVWQAGLPFGFDGASYKETLSRREVRGRCVVIVDAGERDAATNQRIAALLRVGDVDEVLGLGEGRFEVRSPMYDTATDSEYDSVFSNVRLHQWFKRYTQVALVPLHALGLVKHVRFGALARSSGDSRR
jgi:hypothetical protein